MHFSSWTWGQTEWQILNYRIPWDNTSVKLAFQHQSQTSLQGRSLVSYQRENCNSRGRNGTCDLSSLAFILAWEATLPPNTSFPWEKTEVWWLFLHSQPPKKEEKAAKRIEVGGTVCSVKERGLHHWNSLTEVWGTSLTEVWGAKLISVDPDFWNQKIF